MRPASPRCPSNRVKPSCLGNLTDALHISPQLADNVMKGLLAFMLIGSVSLLFAHHRRREASETVAEQMPG